MGKEDELKLGGKVTRPVHKKQLLRRTALPPSLCPPPLGAVTPIFLSGGPHFVTRQNASELKAAHSVKTTFWGGRWGWGRIPPAPHSQGGLGISTSHSFQG